MKHLLFLLTSIACCCSLQAQLLYGTASVGGAGTSGTITKLDVANNTLSAAYSLQNDGTELINPPVQASDGKLYGMTSEGGGSYDVGVIYSFNPATHAYTKLYSFDITNGAHPQGSLIQANDGKLYGTTSKGGGSNNGVIFSFNLATGTYTKLYDFDGVNGANPVCTLLQASDGKLYGLTPQGPYNRGVIFSFDPVMHTYTDVYNFDFSSGANPFGSLIQASDGKLYSTTNDGGSHKDGVVFSFDLTTHTYTDVYDFDGVNGAAPQNSLVQASDGKFYGTALLKTNSNGENNGNIFSFDPATHTYTDVYDFDGYSGASPFGYLVQASDGKLYGLASRGAGFGNGSLFSFDPVTHVLSSLHSFKDNPHGSLMLATNGKLHGVDRFDDSTLGESLFSFDPVASTFTTLVAFPTQSDGFTVSGGLLKAADGNFYGMTTSGVGNSHYGVIFSFNPATNAYSKLYNFHYNNDGGSPYGSLIQASDGKLYGTAEGGTYNDGVIFSFDPATNTYTKRIDFAIDLGQYRPYGGLMQASDGKLYGMANNSPFLSGLIFSFDPATNTSTQLKVLDGTTGGKPYGGLVQASNGKLYGMTSEGGSSNNGVIFSFDPATNKYVKVKEFNGVNGAHPHGDLMQASDGKLYGLTTAGGSNNTGVLFSFDPATNTFSKRKEFTGSNGANPYGNLMQASDSKLYGMTYNGGSNNGGVAFSFDPATGVYSKRVDFTSATGLHPANTFFVEGQAGGGIALPKIRISNDTLFEGNSGQQAMTFTVSLSVKPVQSATVDYATVNRTANAPSDYIAQSGTLTFAPGEKTKTVSIFINGDKTKERDETFAVALHNATNATLKDSTGIGVIRNDDGAAINTAKDLTVLPNLANNTEQNLTVFPNPASSLVQVKLGGYSGKVMLQLTDRQGKVLKEVTVQSADAKSAQQQQFNVAGLTSGTYFIVVVDKGGNKQSKQIVVTH